MTTPNAIALDSLVYIDPLAEHLLTLGPAAARVLIYPDGSVEVQSTDTVEIRWIALRDNPDEDFAIPVRRPRSVVMSADMWVSGEASTTGTPYKVDLAPACLEAAERQGIPVHQLR